MHLSLKEHVSYLVTQTHPVPHDDQYRSTYIDLFRAFGKVNSKETQNAFFYQSEDLLLISFAN